MTAATRLIAGRPVFLSITFPVQTSAGSDSSPLIFLSLGPNAGRG
jgi:hypothetical protein